MATEQDPATSEATTFRKILVGFDGSTEARRALLVALALGADLHGDVHLLLVLRRPVHTETVEEGASAAEAEMNNLSQGLSELQPLLCGPSEISKEVLYGDDPAKILATYAEEHAFDIMVVGGHGREQTTHRGIGHSLKALLNNHPCPVLVV